MQFWACFCKQKRVLRNKNSAARQGGEGKYFHHEATQVSTKESKEKIKMRNKRKLKEEDNGGIGIHNVWLEKSC